MFQYNNILETLTPNISIWGNKYDEVISILKPFTTETNGLKYPLFDELGSLNGSPSYKELFDNNSWCIHAFELMKGYGSYEHNREVFINLMIILHITHLTWARTSTESLLDHFSTLTNAVG